MKSNIKLKIAVAVMPVVNGLIVLIVILCFKWWEKSGDQLMTLKIKGKPLTQCIVQEYSMSKINGMYSALLYMGHTNVSPWFLSYVEKGSTNSVGVSYVVGGKRIYEKPASIPQLINVLDIEGLEVTSVRVIRGLNKKMVTLGMLTNGLDLFPKVDKIIWHTIK